MALLEDIVDFCKKELSIPQEILVSVEVEDISEDNVKIFIFDINELFGSIKDSFFITLISSKSIFLLSVSVLLHANKNINDIAKIRIVIW